MKYTAPIVVSSSETLTAIAAFSATNHSAATAATYTIVPLAVAVPVFSVASGTYTSAQTVTITDSTPGVAIYTSTTPSVTASFVKYTAPILVSSSETLTAVAVLSASKYSSPASATYTITSGTTVVAVLTNANGNITSIPPAGSNTNATFTYNNANRLASVTGTPVAANYIYDWAGQRFSKTYNGTPPTVFSYKGGTLISESSNGIATDYIYVDGRPVAVLQAGASPVANQVNYIHADRLGTPQLATNSSRSVVWNTAYQPFGATQTVISSITQNLRFPGQYSDPEAGFGYNLNRDYMPNLGRYLETDPIGLTGGVNTYAYVDANPWKFTDISGEISRPVIICILRLLCTEPEDKFDPNSHYEWSPQEEVECPKPRRPSYFKRD